MKSRASISSHPLHPMLIPFPFAFLTGGAVADAAGTWAGEPIWWTVGGCLIAAGVVTGAIAAIPGFIDYFYTVPPASSGKRRATQHMLVNLSVLAAFALAWRLRGGVAVAPPGVLLALEMAATVMLGIGGWLGGTLVYRNQIGIDHRYARAGKWQERSIAGARRQKIVVARKDELEPDQMRLLHVNGRRVVLGRTDDEYVAFDDRCTHKGGPLADGVLICGRVQCPWHGSQFDTRTGAVVAGPADTKIAVYSVTEERDKVSVEV